MAKTKDFVEGLSIGNLLTTEKKPEKTADSIEEILNDRKRPGWYDYRKEILDTETGYVYEKKRGNKKGKILRKFFERLHQGYSRDEGITFWKPKIFDLAYCEEKRWNAIEYQRHQYAKIIGAFDLVVKNVPFSCIKITDQYPGFKWVEFPKYESQNPGVSYDWWEHSYRNKLKSDKPNSPLKPDVGDAWFYYEERSKVIRERTSHFERLFQLALEYRYASAFYRAGDYTTTKLNLVINGRNYLIGRPDNRSFGVIAYPEETITQIILPGPSKPIDKMAKNGRYVINDEAEMEEYD